MLVALDLPHVRLLNGDCTKLELPESSVDSLVTDPPAGIGFMGKAWDSNKGGRDNWVAWLGEALGPAFRALKPGAHGLVWALPKTSHWTAYALELAGFEVRDRVSHLFGTGFPKSLNVSKEIDRVLGTSRPVLGANPNHRAISGVEYEGVYAGGNTGAAEITGPGSPDAAKWSGFGTALKPACEDWWLVRKPLSDTVARNVLAHGTGALNVDGCRIGTAGGTRFAGKRGDDFFGMGNGYEPKVETIDAGRWPAHLMLDESAAASLGEPARFFYVAKPSKKERNAGVANNNHPTVKSIALMRWLIRLITPPGGLVLDPFCGSGSTGVAALAEGFRFIGVEQSAEYTEIARGRLVANDND